MGNEIRKILICIENLSKTDTNLLELYRGHKILIEQLTLRITELEKQSELHHQVDLKIFERILLLEQANETRI